jgi:hypothetical protein
MVTELAMSIKVIMPTNTKGNLPCISGIAEKTSSGNGQLAALNLRAAYASKSAENVNASDNKKNHIISFP